MKIPSEIAVTLDELTRYEHLVSDFSLLPRQPVHSVLSGKHASKLRGRGLDFSEVRKYVYGDDIRNIDWKVTARTRETHTKVFNEEKERPAFLIIDQSSSMFFASQGSVKSVLAAKLAAIAGFKVLKAGDRIGGLVFDDKSYEFIKPRRSRRTFMHLLEVLAAKNQNLVNCQKMLPKQGIMDKVLFQANNIVTHDYVVVVISDFQQLDEQGFQYLTSIARHNDLIAALICDPLEMELPSVKMLVGDGTYQILLSGKQGIRDKFKASSATIRENVVKYSRKYGIPLMEFNTIEPLADQLKRIFGKR